MKDVLRYHRADPKFIYLIDKSNISRESPEIIKLQLFNTKRIGEKYGFDRKPCYVIITL